MKFSHYLEVNSRDIWRSQYIKYKELKKLLHEVLETGAPVVVPHALSFSVQNQDLAAALQRARTPQERFFIELESQVAVVNSFTQAQAQLLRHQLRLIEARLKALTTASRPSSQDGAQPLQGTSPTGPAGERRPGSPQLRAQLRRSAEHGNVRGRSLGGAVGTRQAASPRATEQRAAAGCSKAGDVSSALPQLPAHPDVLTSATSQQQEEYAHARQGPSSADAVTGMLAAETEGSGQGRGGVNITRAASVAAMPPQHLDQQAEWAQLQADARTVGREYLALEKYVNLNYAALQKILKKHDKLLPTAPCWGFYRIHTSHQPWVRGDHHDIQVTLARIFTQLHAAARMKCTTALMALSSNAPAPSSLHAQHAQHAHHAGTGTPLLDPQIHRIETTRKFWVRAEDIAEFEYNVLQHMPVRAPDFSQHDPCRSSQHPGDCMHRQVNMLYLDNASLELYHNLLYGRPYAALVRLLWEGDGPLRPADRVVLQRKVYRDGWQPDTAITDGLPLEARRVAEFLAGRWTFADARKYLMQQQQQDWRPGSSSASGADRAQRPQPQGLAAEMEATAREYALFKTYTEVQRLVETKALQPVVTLCMRQTLYEDPDAATATAARQSGTYATAEAQQQGEWERTDGETGVPLSSMRPSAVAVAAGGAEINMSPKDETLGTEQDTGREELQGGATPSTSAAQQKHVAVVRRVQLDSHMRALLEYSYDGLARISHGLWHQTRHTDAVDFPYGCVTVELDPPNGGDDNDDADTLLQPTMLPHWLQHMVDAGKLLEVPDFSKFLFGCAGLLPDMVRAVPVWIDDPLVARFLTAQVMGHQQQQQQQHGHGSQAAGNGSHYQGSASAPALQHVESHRTQVIHHAHETAEGGGGEENGRRLRKSVSSRSNGVATAAGAASSSFQTRKPPGDAADDAGLNHHSSKSLRTTWSAPVFGDSALWGRSSSLALSAPQGWQLKLLARQQSKGRVYAPQALFIEPGQFLRNERIFVTWLTMTITLSGFACGMLGFASAAIKDPQVWHMYLVEWTSFALLAVAIVMCVYGLMVYTWRSQSLYELRPHRYDDVRGSVMMNLVWVVTLLALLLLNLYDLVEVVTHGGSQGGGDGGDDDGGDYQPPPPPMVPPPYPAPADTHLLAIPVAGWQTEDKTGVAFVQRSLQQSLQLSECQWHEGAGPVTQRVQHLVCVLLHGVVHIAGMFGR